MVVMVLGSGLRPACTDWSALGPMLISEMEAALRSLDSRVEKLDQRVGRIEQILPTLATKVDLRDEIRGVRVLVEDVRSEVRLLAESVDGSFKVVHNRLEAEAAGLSRRMDDLSLALQQQLAEVLRRLDRR